MPHRVTPITELSYGRSDEPELISGYLDKSDAFDKAVAASSLANAAQNELDDALTRAIHDDKVKAVIEEEK